MKTKLSLVPFYCFLFFHETVKETTRTNIMQIFWCSKLLKYYNKTDHKILLIVCCSIYSLLIWVPEINQVVFFKIWSDILMLKIAEILKQKGTDLKTLLVVSCSIYSFLIWVSETIETVLFKIQIDMLMLKIFKIFQQKGTDHHTLKIRRFLFLVPYIPFLIESLKLIRQFSPRFDQISGCSKLLKCFNIFQKFLLSSKFFLFYNNVSYFSTLHQRVFFLNETNSCSCSNCLKYYIKILTLILSAAILYRCGGVRNYFLYKAPIYLPTEDIKPFGQNGWSIRTWEPWLLSEVYI